MTPLVIFDFEGTLAESVHPITPEVATLLGKLLSRTRIAIISCGTLEHFLKQAVDHLPSDAHLKNLYLLPTSGASLFEYQGSSWKKIYEERISELEAQEIERALLTACKETGLINFSTPSYGPRIQYHGGEVILSALGQLAPDSEKKKWDPDHKKRLALEASIAKHLPKKFHAATSGLTTFSVTKKGVDKAYGVHQLGERLHIPESEILYVGDELGKNGSDEVVFKTEAKTQPVKNPAETVHLIRKLVSP